MPRARSAVVKRYAADALTGRSLREALNLYREIGATNHAARLGTEIEA
jgi:hypothetical protein